MKKKDGCNKISGLPKLTICIPVYNGQDTIVRAVKSAVEQSYDNYDVVISNNCSTDKTLELIKNNFSDEIGSHKIQLHNRDENYGVLNNFRYVVNESDGEYVLILGADDYISNTCLEVLYGNIKGEGVNASCGVVDRFTDIERFLVSIPLYKSKRQIINNCCSSEKINFLFCGLWDRKLLINTFRHIQNDLSINGSSSDRIMVMAAAWFYNLRYATTEEVVYFKNAGKTNRIKNRMGKAYLYSIFNSFQVPIGEDNNETGGNKLGWYLYVFPKWCIFLGKNIFYQMLKINILVKKIYELIGGDNIRALKLFMKTRLRYKNKE